MKLHHVLMLCLSLLATVPAAQAATPPADSAAATESADKIHLNSANAAQLETLKGVGPKTAQAIIAWREKSGPFKSVDQLLAVKGIGPATLAKMRDRLAL